MKQVPVFVLNVLLPGLALIALSLPPALAQPPAQHNSSGVNHASLPADDSPAFEVATIKPVDSNRSHPHDLNVYPGGRILLRGYSLRSLIMTAYKLSSWQLSGGDPSMSNDLYDIEAIPPSNSASTPYDIRHTWWLIEDSRLRQMLQSLLGDRFQLKLHQTSGNDLVYLLEKSGKTSLLTPTAAETSTHPSGGEGFSGDIGHGGDRWVIYNTSMQQLAQFASDIVIHKKVLDQTGLSGYFDAKWTQTLDDPEQYDGMDSFQTFLSALGLRLRQSTGSVENYEIVSAQKPSPN
jgi:uncharacterized protein (TIGR03435 family)